MRYIIATLLITLFSAIGPQSQAQELQDTISSVFLLGENEGYYNRLSEKYNHTLLHVTDNNMEQAYQVWIQMQKDMETYAETIDFDLNGVKIWMHAYWAEDGKLEFISFFPKPNSINIPVQEIRAFLLSFQRQYYSQVQSDGGFSHYASAHFPTMLQTSKADDVQGY